MQRYLMPYAKCMQTSIRVSPDTRDRLAEIARKQLRGVSLDEALRVMLAEHDQLVRERTARLVANEGLLAEIRRRRATPLEESVDHETVLTALKARVGGDLQSG